MKDMAKIDTNHSNRKTTMCKLQKARISNDKIAAITGHKNEQSLRDYASADLDDHRKLSATPVSARTPLTEVDHNHGSFTVLLPQLHSPFLWYPKPSKKTEAYDHRLFALCNYLHSKLSHSSQIAHLLYRWY